MKVPLLDLKLQYSTIKKEIDETLIRLAESQYFVLGPDVEAMEKNLANYLNSKFALGVSSGTDALLIALMAIDLKPGDEVILPDFSFFATAGVVSRMNAIPVFADIDPVTYNIDVNRIESLITSKTKAIIPVHLFGQSADMDKLIEIKKKYNLYIIEDACQSIGTQYSDGRAVGTIGDIGCFSFFPSKNLGCFGDGGLVTTQSEDLYNKMKLLRVHGMEAQYYHKIIGGNFRLDALQAAIINVKLPHLDKWSERRRQNAELYNKLFIEKELSKGFQNHDFENNNKVILPKAVYKANADSGIRNYHIYNQYVIRVQKRDELKDFLAKKEIGTAIYYPVPFHKQECFKYLKSEDKDFKFSNVCADTVLALPVFPELKQEQIEYVVKCIEEFMKNGN